MLLLKHTANKATILNRGAELPRMAYSELWKVGQQAKGLEQMTSSPCCPSESDW